LKEGGSTSKKKGSYCHAGTYINSFFTTFGVESFAGPMGLGVDTANSYCTSNAEGGGDGGENQNYQDVAADDDYLNDDYQYYNYGQYSSYGTGCSVAGKFVTDSYDGAFCHGSNYKETLNTLDSFNEAMESFECTQIYSASGSNNQDERRTEEEEYDFEEMDAVKILSFSKSCSLSQYPQDCPDPYGKKKIYAARIQRALEYKTGKSRYLGTKLMKAFAWLSLLGSFALLVGAFAIDRRRKKLLIMRGHKKTKYYISRHKQQTLDDPVFEGTERTLNEYEMPEMVEVCNNKSGKVSSEAFNDSFENVQGQSLSETNEPEFEGTEKTLNEFEMDEQQGETPSAADIFNQSFEQAQLFRNCKKDKPTTEGSEKVLGEFGAFSDCQAPSSSAVFGQAFQMVQDETAINDESEEDGTDEATGSLPRRRSFVFPLDESQIEAVFEGDPEDGQEGEGDVFFDARHQSVVLSSDEKSQVETELEGEPSESSDTSFELLNDSDLGESNATSGRSQSFVFSMADSQVEAALEGETCDQVICEMYMKKKTDRVSSVFKRKKK